MYRALSTEYVQSLHTTAALIQSRATWLHAPHVSDGGGVLQQQIRRVHSGQRQLLHLHTATHTTAATRVVLATPPAPFPPEDPADAPSDRAPHSLVLALEPQQPSGRHRARQQTQP